VANHGQLLASEPLGTSGQGSSAVDHAVSGPQLQADEERRHAEYMAGIAAAFRSEPISPSWSSGTAAMVRSAIAQDEALRRLAGDAECRARTCRVEIADDGSGTLGKVVPLFALHVGPELPSVAAERVVADAGGAARMVLYMSRGDDGMPTAP
jgi:hypothetical protein